MQFRRLGVSAHPFIGYGYLNVTAQEVNRRDNIELAQCRTDGGRQNREYRLLISELDLRLGRVDIDVNLLRRYVKIDEVRRQLFSRQHACIRLHHGFVEIGVTHVSSVDEEQLLRLLRCHLGLAYKPADVHQLGLLLDLQQLGGIELALALAEHVLYTLLVRACRQVVHNLIVRRKRE